MQELTAARKRTLELEAEPLNQCFIKVCQDHKRSTLRYEQILEEKQKELERLMEENQLLRQNSRVSASTQKIGCQCSNPDEDKLSKSVIDDQAQSGHSSRASHQ